MNCPGFLLLHGAWAGHSVWDCAAPHLRATGHVVLAPDLPGGNLTGDIAVGVDDRVAFALAVLPSAGGPWIVVGHSGGGIMTTMLAEVLGKQAPDSVIGLVHLAGMMQPSGMDFPEACRIAAAPPAQLTLPAAPNPV